MAGLAAAGALTSGLRLVTKAAFENSNNGLRKGALLFMSISTLLEFLCIFLYALVFPKLPIVKYYRSKAASEGSKTVSADLAAAGIETTEIKVSTLHNNLSLFSSSFSYDLKLYDFPSQDADTKKFQRLTLKQLLIKNIDYLLDLFLIYVLTLSIIPGFLYENTGTHGLGTW